MHDGYFHGNVPGKAVSIFTENSVTRGFNIRLYRLFRRGALDTTLCDKICQ